MIKNVSRVVEKRHATVQSHKLIKIAIWKMFMVVESSEL